MYGGKLPRGKLSEYQQRIIKKFDAVAKGRATVVTPKNPKDYAKLFTVKGDKVIVPRTKGEKISTNKHGNITRERKLGRGQKSKGVLKRYKEFKTPEKPEPSRRVQYAIPFARKVSKGVYRLEWKRFPNWETLEKYMMGSDSVRDYDDWQHYVFEEEISELSREERDAALNDAALKYGRAKSTGEFTSGPLSDVMRVAKKTRRRQQSKRYLKRGRE